MGYTPEQKRRIYDKTDGYCHICGKKLSIKNYGILGARGSWEVDHGIPSSKGGSDHGNNYWPACISCNRSKGDRSTRAARRDLGFDRAPYIEEYNPPRPGGCTAYFALVGGATAKAYGKSWQSIALCAAIGAGAGFLLDN